LFLKAIRLQKGKITNGPIFFSAPNFSAKLAGKVCKELATLEEIGFDQP
jgi:hypothetical protein